MCWFTDKLQHAEDQNYLTRRIRCQVCGPNFQAVQEKQLTIPLIIPYHLEDYLERKLSEVYSDLPLMASKPVIPLHDSTKYDAAHSNLPSLNDNTTRDGNLKYWVITNTSMWARQHRVLDETAEILRSLCVLFQRLRSTTETFNSFGPAHFRQWHKRRYHESLDQNRRELLLFRQWVLPTVPPPHSTQRARDRPSDTTHPLFDGKALRYPFPNNFFWKDGDEGEWDRGDGVPEWREYRPASECSDSNRPKSETPDLACTGDLRESPFFKGRLNSPSRE